MPLFLHAYAGELSALISWGIHGSRECLRFAEASLGLELSLKTFPSEQAVLGTK